MIEKRKQNNEWELNMTFQDSWVRKFPWVELVKSLYGIFFMMCCKFYTIIEYKEKLYSLLLYEMSPSGKSKFLLVKLDLQLTTNNGEVGSKLDGLRKHNEKNMC